MDTVLENQRLEAVLGEDEQRGTPSPGQKSTKTPTKTRKGTPTKRRRFSKTSPSPAGNGSASHDSLWKVTRTINFDECQRLVDIKIHADRNTKTSLSRSSVATYILRGEEELRIERALVEGSIIAFTNSDQEESVDTFTNQTIELKAVRKITEELPVDQDVHPRPWHFEAAYQTGDAYPSVEQAVIGLNLSHRTLEEKKAYILAELGDLSQRATGGEHRGFPLMKQYTGLVEAVSCLSYEDLNLVFTRLGRELVEAVDGHSGFDLVNVNLWKITVFQQALISAGTEPALNLILNTLKDESLPTSEGTSQRLFAQLAVTLKTPTLMPQILEFVKSLTWSRKDRDAKSVAMIDFAKLARALCLDARKAEAHGEAECDPARACAPRLILEEFLPYLEQGIVDQASPIWIRLVHIHALSQLRVPHALAILQPLVLGLSRTEPRLRIHAIRGLSFFSVHPVVRDEVFELLTSVADNPGENPRVRNMAFLTLTTWAPDLSWWQAAAVSTWHEPSVQVANFVSSTITSMANSETDISKVVSRVVPLAKPAAPASLSFSTNLDIGVAWLASAEDLFPAHVFLTLKTCALYNSVFHSESEVHQRNLARLWLKTPGPPARKKKEEEEEEEEASDDDFDIVVGMFNEIKEQLGVESQKKVLDATWTIKFQQLLRLSLKLLPGARFKTVREFVNAMMSKMGNHVLLFHKFIDSSLVVPTDLGLPLVVKYDGSFVSCTTARLEQPSNPRLDVAPGVPMFLGAEVASDTDHQVSLVAKTLLPWYENLAVGAGLQGGWSLQLPFLVRTSDLTLRHGGGSVSFEPVATQTFNLVAAHNTPFTFVSIRDPNDLITRPDWRTVMLSDLKNYSAPVLPPTLGLRVESTWAGDVPQPQAPGSLFSFGLSSPISYLWNYYVTFDPAASTTKSVVFSFVCVHNVFFFLSLPFSPFILKKNILSPNPPHYSLILPFLPCPFLSFFSHLSSHTSPPLYSPFFPSPSPSSLFSPFPSHLASSVPYSSPFPLLLRHSFPFFPSHTPALYPLILPLFPFSFTLFPIFPSPHPPLIPSFSSLPPHLSPLTPPPHPSFFPFSPHLSFSTTPHTRYYPYFHISVARRAALSTLLPHRDLRAELLLSTVEYILLTRWAPALDIRLISPNIVTHDASSFIEAGHDASFSSYNDLFLLHALTSPPPPPCTLQRASDHSSRRMRGACTRYHTQRNPLVKSPQLSDVSTRRKFLARPQLLNGRTLRVIAAGKNVSGLD
ncbi:clotting protein precursor [Penaeus vannamei]|uniref:Clotting protein n=1 Tax=Penaeus vannamei TaxID=6689 RepID=A0A3R7LVQ6_PENVA|nr:clotting protein precursor [Penaeus vannamei]